MTRDQTQIRNDEKSPNSKAEALTLPDDGDEVKSPLMNWND